jgi:hypothetical protein
MKLASTKHAFTLCAVLAALPGLAIAGGENLQVRDLAKATGLTCSEVKMVLGARTPYFEYVTSYARAQKQLEQALGTQRYRDLMAGREITLDNGQRFALAAR